MRGRQRRHGICNQVTAITRGTIQFDRQCAVRGEWRHALCVCMCKSAGAGLANACSQLLLYAKHVPSIQKDRVCRLLCPGALPACPRIQDHGTTQNAPKRLAEDSVSKYALQDQGPRGGVGRTLCRTLQDGSRRSGRRSLHSFRPRARVRRRHKRRRSLARSLCSSLLSYR